METPQLAPHHTAAAGESGVASRAVLGLRVDATSYDRAAAALLERAAAGEGAVVCVATVHMVMEAWDDPRFRRIVNAADLVTPDGVPLVWALRALGVREATRVYGPRLTEILCERAAGQGVPVGFYGGAPEVVEMLCARLTARHPGLRIAFRASPPFRPATPEEDHKAREEIRASGARLLFVGLGCPKQERWMDAHRDLPCVQLGVGAAFDFLAGAKPQAPAWLQAAGLEWLFRLACEPRRLWRRYAVHNPRFILHFARQWARARRDPR